jgi:hypothetical protein
LPAARLQRPSSHDVARSTATRTAEAI